MELRQLVYFEAVVRCGGFTRAAEALHIAQPAVSAQIRRLEAELGVALLTRTTRRFALTSAGELLLVRTRRVLDELEGARGDLAQLSDVMRGRVALGATLVLGGFDLPVALAAFHGRYRGVALALRSGLVAELLALLDAGEVDLVLGPIHDNLPSRFSALPLVDEQLVVITPPGHPLTRDSQVAFEQLRDEPFVCLPSGSGLRAILDEAAAAAGFAPHVPFETYSPSSIRDLVSAGLGIAALARSAVLAPGPPVGICPVRPPLAHPRVGLIHSRDHRLTAAAQACRRHLARYSTLRPRVAQPG